jgi:hypothetical protein
MLLSPKIYEWHTKCKSHLRVFSCTRMGSIFINTSIIRIKVNQSAGKVKENLKLQIVLTLKLIQRGRTSYLSLVPQTLYAYKISLKSKVVVLTTVLI